MKILQIGKYYHPHIGGVETHTNHLVTGLAKLDHNITLVVSNDGMTHKEETYKNIHIIRYPKIFEILNAPINIGFLFHNTEKFDIVHAHLPNPFATIGLLLHRQKKLIVTYHSDIIKHGLFAKFMNFLYTKLILKKLLRRSNKIIITNPKYGTESPVLGDFKKKIIVIPHGIDVGKFKLTSEIKTDIKKLKNKFGDRKFILFVGRLVPYKGLEYLIRAVSQLINNNPNVLLLIIGDGPLKKKLKNLVLRLELDKNVKFIGIIGGEITSFYYLCDMFILPSIYRSEAFGISILEAMACGKPIISTSVTGSGTSFVNKNNETGIVVKPKDVSGLISAIEKLLNNDTLRRKFGKNAKMRIKKNFTKELMVKTTSKVYEDLCK